MRSITAAILLLAGCAGGEKPPVVRVAVAGNFAAPAAELAAVFQEQTGIGVEISVGSSGQLFAQLSHGAPFDVFLSADQDRPAALVEAGLAVENSRFVYAVGHLALAFAEGADRSGRTPSRTRTVAIANPRTAPYGVAARKILDSGLWSNRGEDVVIAANVAQAWQLVESGAVDAAFVSVAQVQDWDGVWERIPEDAYEPIRQEAVLMKSSETVTEAERFLEFLRSDLARGMIDSLGYGLGGGPS